MEKLTRDATDEELTQLVFENKRHYYDYISQSKRVNFYKEGGIEYTISDHPFLFYNQVVSCDVKTAAGADEEKNYTNLISKILQKYVAAKKPCIWTLDRKSLHIQKYLKKAGFVEMGTSPAIHFDLTKFDETKYKIDDDLEFREITSDNNKDVSDYSRVMVTSFGLPSSKTIIPIFTQIFSEAPCGPTEKLHHYIGISKSTNTVVCTGSMFEGGGVAGLYNVTTSPAARRKGLGSKITAYTMVEARKLGYRYMTGQASHKGWFVYQKMGWGSDYNMVSYFKANGANILASLLELGVRLLGSKKKRRTAVSLVVVIIAVVLFFFVAK